MLKIKDNVDLKELEKYGFKEKQSCYAKQVTNKRFIEIWKFNREIKVVVLDYTTYTGYKYLRGHNQVIKPYIQNLIQAGLVEKV